MAIKIIATYDFDKDKNQNLKKVMLCYKIIMSNNLFSANTKKSLACILP